MEGRRSNGEMHGVFVADDTTCFSGRAGAGIAVRLCFGFGLGSGVYIHIRFN